MNEATVVRAVVTHLRDHLPGAVIFKLNDRITAGIPDLAVTHGGRTFWLEVKLIRNWEEPPSSLRKKFEAQQLATLVRLSRQGQAYYLVAYEGKKMLDLVAPARIFDRLAQLPNKPGLWAKGPFKASLALLTTMIANVPQEPNHDPD